MKYREQWDDHWKKLDKSFFGRLTEFHRKIIISKAVSYYMDRYFPDKGTFVECGSGTSQTSIKINKRKRRLIALDISSQALNEARNVKKIDHFIKADIFRLPFKDDCIDGIWNLGVMEHFSKSEISHVLSEFYRVMKDGSHIILFWPPMHGSSQIALRPVEKFFNMLKKEKFQFFPGEISKPKSRSHAKSLLGSKFKVVDIHFDRRDMFTHYVVVCRK
ncbi:MAG: class I SAM-dependent methyltransferase [Candidatus Aenigmatarchaeota archaeon]